MPTSSLFLDGSGMLLATAMAWAWRRSWKAVHVSGNAAKLRRVAARSESGAGGAATVGEAISADLRRLQESGRQSLDILGIVEALVPCVSLLLGQDLFVSLSRTRDGRSLRLSVKLGAEWVEFYSADPDAAAELGEGVVAAFGV